MSVGTPPSIDASSTSSASLVVSSMAPPRAFAWPTSVYEDPAVLRLDPSGRFILCRACLEHHDRCGGKTPKPVIMNARYRIRAWDTHKRRTRAHRLWPVNANDLQVQEPLRVDDCRPASRIAAASDSCVNSWTSRSIVCPQRIEVAPLPSYDAIWKSHVSCASSPEEASVPPLHVRRYSDSLSALSSGDRQLLQQISPRTCDAYVEPEPVMHQENRTEKTLPIPSSRGHQLHRILNPATCEEIVRPRERLELSAWAQEKIQKNQLRPCCNGHSETHQLYWNTLRQVFSEPKKTRRRSVAAIVANDIDV